MDYLSSMYIDDEMDLNAKKQFVEKVRYDKDFYKQTLDLLELEQLIEIQPVLPEPLPGNRWRPPIWTRLAGLLKPIGYTAAGFSTAVLMLFTFFQSPHLPLCNNRFVLFEPAANQVELVGSFTGWQKVAMERIGNSGYWELNLHLVSGEHRFAYILNGHSRIADPTLPAREADDFGGENSILNIETRI
jgi:hypothetical protein